MLILSRDCESCKNQGEDEYVVDGETFLDEIPGEVLAASFGPVDPPDNQTERHPQADPDRAPDSRLAQGHDVLASVRDEIDGQHREDRDKNRKPSPERY